MKKLLGILFFLLTLCLVNCNERVGDKTLTNESVPVINDLAGKIYMFAPDLDTTTCTVSGACDCCTSDIFFLNEIDFVSISYCESDESISKGKYKIEKESIVLNYDPIYVEQVYNWEKETDTTGSVTTEYFINTKVRKTAQVILRKIYCKGKLCFKVGDDVIDFGVEDTKSSLESFIQGLKSDSTWYKLGGK